MIVYEGPSMFGGRVGAAVTRTDTNGKLSGVAGALAQQLWVLTDEHPAAAVQGGCDAAICGTCPLRAWRSGQRTTRLCYVNLLPASSVWRAWKRGTYPAGQPADAARRTADLMRLGAWGDPAALPTRVVLDLTGQKPHVGYTHAWRTCDPDLRRCLMASCDSPEEREEARALGWRTFLVAPSLEALRALPRRGAVVCPASREGGYRRSCAQCQLCSGWWGHGRRLPDIVIVQHGPPNTAKARLAYYEARWGLGGI